MCIQPRTYAYIHVHMQTSTYICIQPRTYAYIHVHMHTTTYICIHQRTHAYNHVHMHTSTYICTRALRRDSFSKRTTEKLGTREMHMDYVSRAVSVSAFLALMSFVLACIYMKKKIDLRVFVRARECHGAMHRWAHVGYLCWSDMKEQVMYVHTLISLTRMQIHLQAKNNQKVSF